MSNSMHYKGYDASVAFSDEDDLLYGKVEGIRSLISFEGEDVSSLRVAFEEAIDDYLETCKEGGIEPEMPYKGSLNIRIGSKLHRKVSLLAGQRKKSVNYMIKRALEREYMKR